MLFALIDPLPLVASVFGVLLLVYILPIWFTWVALSRAGLPAALSLLGIPFGLLGIIVAIGVLAFARWPAMDAAFTQR